jgi:glucose uptake protein
LYYFDYAFGVLLTALIAAFTFGSMGVELSFLDNLAVSRIRQLIFGFAGGVVFNLANMLLVAAIAVAGLAVAFPVGIGLALVIGVIWNYILRPAGNPILLFAGAGLVLIAVLVDAMAYAAHARSRPQRRAGQVGLKGILLSLVSGVLMGSFYPLVELGKQGEVGLGPYAIAFLFAIGVFISTFMFNMYFMNLPVQGEPVSFGAYFQGTFTQHLLGVLGGIIWCTGAIANFVAASAPPSVNVGPAVSYAIGQGATMISALWGLLVWKEFAGATGKVKGLLALMMLLFLIGLTLVSIAPLYR